MHDRSICLWVNMYITHAEVDLWSLIWYHEYVLYAVASADFSKSVEMFAKPLSNLVPAWEGMHQCEQYGYHWAFASDPLCCWLSSGSQGLRASVEPRYSKHFGNLKPWKLSHVRNQICGFLDLLQANRWTILFHYPLAKVDGTIPM